MINAAVPDSPSGLTAREVAERLGVEVATVYAYASRGALTRTTAADGRTSLYDPDQAEALARRARPRSARRSAAAIDVVIGTTVSEIGDGWIRYRGIDLGGLADRHFEDLAHLLWTGRDESSPTMADTELEPTRRAVRRVVAALPRSALISSRLAAAAAAVSPLLPAVTDDMAEVGRLLIDAFVEALPSVGAVSAARTRNSSVATRLWGRCSPLPPTSRRIAALDRALVLLAEHELATSTLAVRVAASTRAAPAEVLLAGLGTMSGPLHGRAAAAVQRRLAAPAAGNAAGSAADPLAGTGHSVHLSGDPRYPLLAPAVLSIATAAQRRRIEADLAAVRAQGVLPNIDLALGGLGFIANAPEGVTEAVFAIARTAGWLAHAHEEADETPLRFRGRTMYRRAPMP